MTKPTLEALLNQMFDAKVAAIHTALPAKIATYDFTKQQATVKPVLKKKYYNDSVVEMPIITNVPVVFPRGGSGSLTFPLEKDDPVLLIFAERALERWLSNGGEQEPGSVRKYDLSDAIAIPGIYPFNEASPALEDALLLKYKNSSITISGNGEVAVKGLNGSFTIKANGEISIDGINGSIIINTEGKISIGNSTIELMDWLDRFIGQVSDITVGGTPIDNKVAMVALQAELDDLKT